MVAVQLLRSKQKRRPGEKGNTELAACAAQRSGDQALGPNGSELAQAASDLSRSPRSSGS